jgi:hypothetical protein
MHLNKGRGEYNQAIETSKLGTDRGNSGGDHDLFGRSICGG